MQHRGLQQSQHTSFSCCHHIPDVFHVCWVASLSTEWTLRSQWKCTKWMRSASPCPLPPRSLSFLLLNKAFLHNTHHCNSIAVLNPVLPISPWPPLHLRSVKRSRAFNFILDTKLKRKITCFHFEQKFICAAHFGDSHRAFHHGGTKFRSHPRIHHVPSGWMSSLCNCRRCDPTTWHRKHAAHQQWPWLYHLMNETRRSLYILLGKMGIF